MLGDPLRVDFKQPGVATPHRSPIRGSRYLFILRLAATQISRHGNSNLLGVRKVQVFHEADKVALIGMAADARIVRTLLADRRHGATTVVVAGKNQAVVRQSEDLLGDRAVERAGVALLEIAAASAPNQQTVAGERHAVV